MEADENTNGLRPSVRGPAIWSRCKASGVLVTLQFNLPTSSVTEWRRSDARRVDERRTTMGSALIAAVVFSESVDCHVDPERVTRLSFPPGCVARRSDGPPTAFCISFQSLCTCGAPGEDIYTRSGEVQETSWQPALRTLLFQAQSTQ